MKIPDKINFKTVAVIVCLSIILTSSFLLVLAQVPGSNLVLSGGIYPSAPTYTVWAEGGNTFAKNQNGELIYSGANTSAIIQNAIDALTSGGTVFLVGVLTIDSTIYLKTAVILKGWGLWAYDSPTRVYSGANDIILVQMNETRCRIEGLVFGSIANPRTQPYIRINEIGSWTIKDVMIQRSRGAGSDSAIGIHIIKTTSGGMSFCRLQDITIYDAFEYGIKLDINAGWFNGNEMYNIVLSGCVYGIYLNRTGVATGMNNNIFTNVKIQSAEDAFVTTLRGFYVENGDGNTFIACKVWDLPAASFSLELDNQCGTNEFIACRFTNIIDAGSRNTFLSSSAFEGNSLLIITMSASEDISAFDGNMTGALWYNTTSNRMEYWNGTHHFYLDDTLIP